MFQSRTPRALFRLQVAALAALLVIVTLPAAGPPALAADDADIPGVPLPGSVVTGRLGGSIYDRVYWIDVPSNRIILMSLTGDAGTDFDLYLFDSSAKSVYAGSGQVAASTGPTSSESISYPVRSGGRYYIDLSGFSEAEGNFRLVVAIATDTKPPLAEVRLNGGAAATTSSTVELSVIGSDDLSGVDQLQVSEDGNTWTEWSPYRPLLLWTFDDVDGPKTIHARVRDRSGNVSAIASSTIILDRAAPSVLEISPAPGARGVRASARLTARFSEAIDPDTLTAGGFAVQDASGSAIAGAIAWDEQTNTARFTPADPLQMGMTYTASIGAVTDIAGNSVVPVGAWTFTTSLTPPIELAARPAVIPYGATISLAGTSQLPILSQLVLERSVAGGAWTSISPVRVGTDGHFSVTTRGTANARFRVRSTASAQDAAAFSAPVRVLVRRGLILADQSPTVVRRDSVGRSMTVTAVVTPSAPKVAVTLTIARYDTTRGQWRTVSTTTKSTTSGRATFVWRPTVAGSYYLRAATPSQSVFSNALSATYRWIIR